MSILCILGECDFHPILQELGAIDKLASDYYWESRAQIIILCSNVLESVNRLELEKAEAKKEMATIKEEEEKRGGDSHREGKKIEDNGGKEEKKQEQVPEEKSHDEIKKEEKQEEEDYKEVEKVIFGILYKVFNESTPTITQKIRLYIPQSLSITKIMVGITYKFCLKFLKKLEPMFLM